ncbi:MAG: succinate dehydrogenase, hydrophobic membrane anchor protein [Pseudomonadota bacterium]
MSLRTPLSQARGLGSAKDGTGHFIAQRITAIALIPLSVWFVFGVLSIVGSDYETAIAWLQNPITSVLLLALIIATFYHADLGMQVVIEDYVSDEFKKTVMLLGSKFAIVLLGLAASLAVIKISLGG